MNQAYPSLNGIEPSWADIAINFALDGGPLLDMADIAALKWGRKVELGEVRGASGGRVMKRTTGQGSQEASCTLYRSGFLNFLVALKNRALQLGYSRGNQAIISLVTFDIVVQHTPPGDATVYETWIKGCRYLGEDDDMKEGADPDKLEINLNPIEIANIVDGVEVVLL